MDEHRFDQLSRRLARFQTRRQALKAIAGAVVATVAGVKGTDAQECTANYSLCGSDGDCCTGAVCEHGLCMPGCRIEGTFYNPWSMPAGDLCQVCAPETSTTNWSPANEGMSCWSGDPNAGVTVCQNGVCTGQAQQSCPPPSPCYLEGEVDPATGMCVNPPAPAGTLCGNSAMCYGDFYTPADTCDGNGFCIGGGSQTRPCAPYQCGQGTCTTSCQTDTDCAPAAHCDDGQCFADLDLGHPCDEDSDCLSGICVEGICCNNRCESLCKTCSAETGGFCSPIICDDGLSCTSGACDETTGECRHTLNPDACLIEGTCYTLGDGNPADACQACDPASDQEAWAARVCPDDGLSCTTATCDSVTGCAQTLDPDACLIDGACYAVGAVNPDNACQVCEPAEAQDGWTAVSCDDGFACTTATCDPITGCDHTINPDSCLIDGVCYAGGDANSANPCQVCDPASDQEAWPRCADGGVCMNGACVTSLTGGITNDDRGRICVEGRVLVSGFPIDAYTFQHAGGPLQIGMRGQDSNSGTLDSPYLNFHSAYDASDPCASWLTFDADSGCGRDAYLTFPDLPAGTYTVVATTGSGNLGSYTLTFGLPPAC